MFIPFLGASRFVSIAAGADHLLALTSAGRTFAHPVTLNANTHGQLGFRKLDLPGRGAHSARIVLELTPKALTGSYRKASPTSRRAPTSNITGKSSAEDERADVDDGSIRFSDQLFEVPALRDVLVERIAAGARSSFVKTKNGRVLGWGANEFGCVLCLPSMSI